MADDAVIIVKNVSKTFKLPHEKSNSIKSAVVNFYRQNRKYERQQVLKDVSFEIKRGEFFGIVGRNGSGKSTLLKLLAGIYTPSEGHIQVNGKLTPFIELGVGFNPELTGRENVFLNGALLGFSRAEVGAMYEDIIKFAELERFMDQKLKNYSSGMQVRLAFSIAIRAQSDILLIDEVLAVGDAAFQTKCFDYFYKLKKTNTTVIFVSHDRGSLERFCERGILINDGEIIDKGPIKNVLQSYSTIVLEELSENEEEYIVQKNHKLQSSYARIENVKALDVDAKEKNNFTFGEEINASFKVIVDKKLVNPVAGITIWCKNVDKAIFATNTLLSNIKDTGTFLPGEEINFTVKLPPLLNDGEYYIEPAIANEAASVFYDQQPRAQTFFIAGSSNPHSLLASDSVVRLERQA